MKGMTVPLTVIMTLVVILVVAVIILVIFQSGLGPAVEASTQTSICKSSASAICSSLNQMPGDWSVSKKVKEGDSIVEKSCATLVGASCKCENNKLVGC